MTTAPHSAVETERISRRPDRAPARVSRLGVCGALYWLTLRQHLHGKRWIAVALLFLVPAGMAVLSRLTRSGVPSTFLEFVLSWILVPQALLPLIALLYASGTIQDEQEGQTITYLLIRPIPKWLLYWVKMAATWTTIVFLVAALTILTYGAIYAGAGYEMSFVFVRCAKTAAILSLAGIAYCSIFGAISLLTKRTLIAGILYIAVIEGVLASFPLSLRLMTVIYYTRLIAYRTLSFVVSWPRGQTEDVAATTWLLDVKADPGLAEHPSLTTCVYVLLGVSFVFTALAGWLCSQREFHVKTPEKQ